MYTYICVCIPGSSTGDFSWQRACCQEIPATVCNWSSCLEMDNIWDWPWSNHDRGKRRASYNISFQNISFPDQSLHKFMIVYVSLVWQVTQRHETSELIKWNGKIHFSSLRKRSAARKKDQIKHLKFCWTQTFTPMEICDPVSSANVPIEKFPLKCHHHLRNFWVDSRIYEILGRQAGKVRASCEVVQG